MCLMSRSQLQETHCSPVAYTSSVMQSFGSSAVAGNGGGIGNDVAILG